MLQLFKVIIFLLCACASTAQRKIDWKSLVVCNGVRSTFFLWSPLLPPVSFLSFSSPFEPQQLADGTALLAR